MSLNLYDGIYTSPREIFLCKVINFNHANNTIDVARVDDSAYIYGAIVVCNLPTSYSYGERYSPSWKNDVPGSAVQEDKYSMYAVCAYASDDFSTTVCLGFLPPRVNELTIPELGLYIFRHESDVIFMVRADSTTFMYHPSGTYIKFGADDTDLIATNAIKTLQTPNLVVRQRFDSSNTGMFIRLFNGQKVTFDKDGNIQILAKTSAGKTSQIDLNGTTGNITVTSENNIDVTATGSITLTSQNNVDIVATNNVNITAAAINMIKG